MSEEAPVQNANTSAKKPATKQPKRISKKKTASKNSLKQRATRKVRAPRSYPAKTLEEALIIPQAIREQNNGNPWDTEDVAQASLHSGKRNNKFFYTAQAARDYGLTIGTRDTEKIAVVPLVETRG